jgi:outer membrane protein insertion porin family
MKLLNRSLLLVLILFTASCNVTKHLPEGEKLFDGATVKVNEENKKIRNELKSELGALVRPGTNKKIFGFRYKLYFYYVAGEPKGKGLRKFIREKLGEEPVLASQANLEKNRIVLENRMQNRGFFHASVTGDTIVSEKKKTVKFSFEATTGPQYKINEINFPPDTTEAISKEIVRSKRRTLLKPGNAYDLDMIKAEHGRIDLWLKNRGYYYFNPGYLLTRVDSGLGDHKVDMYVKLKEVTPDNDKQPYRINNIWVYPTYSIEADSMLSEAPSKRFEDYNIIDPDNVFKPQVFKRMLIFHPGDLYSRRDHNLSLNRLVNLGTFKFVKARFEEVDTAGHYLDPYYFLTPLPKKSWRMEVTGLTKSNNATGGEVSVNWRNRNFLRGAELFTVSVFGGIEGQVNGTQNVATNRFGTELNLYVPRIIAPFRLNTTSEFVSKTRISARYEFFNRSDQYTLNSYRASYGFLWKENIRTEHELKILNANYVNPINITPAFQQILDTNITLRRSIEPQFILGPSYNFNYNSMASPNNKLHNFYFNGNLDLAGNLIGLVSGVSFSNTREGKILGTPFSQYARVEADLRHYLRLNPKNTSKLASRIVAGVAMPYGNSETIPFIKAFFVGGTNSLRAFRARSLGPGTYYVRNQRTDGIIPDQPGDVKLELNTEYRTKLISVLHGALFVDAGNIWTVKEDADRPGSKFSGEFLNQMAVGAGAGIRVDITFLVLRIDLAFPIRKPYLADGPAWVFDQIDFGSADWRKENLILNLAIGYPF